MFMVLNSDQITLRLDILLIKYKVYKVNKRDLKKHSKSNNTDALMQITVGLSSYVKGK